MSIAESLARLRVVTTPIHGDRATVRMDDLRAVLDEFARIEKLIDGEFVAIPEAAVKLVASEGVPEGMVVATDQSGKVHYVGPMVGLPPVIGEIKRLVMNVHPNTLRAIGAASEKNNG